MKLASRHFDDDSRKRINSALAAAESKTSAEIVPVVTTSSGRYDRSEDLAGLCLAILALIVAWMFFQRVDVASTERWDEAKLSLDLVSIIVIVVAGFAVGAIITSHVPWLRRLFTPRGEMQAEVNERARLVFFDQRIHHTKSAGGLLIFVSLFERRAAVIADETVVDKYGMSAIEALCNHLTAKLHDGDLTTALEETIALAGEQLGRVLPRQSDDANELSDALVTID